VELGRPAERPYETATVTCMAENGLFIVVQHWGARG
jgi:hypothetical protein